MNKEQMKTVSDFHAKQMDAMMKALGLDVESLLTDDHDCKLSADGSGHCDHPSHPQI